MPAGSAAPALAALVGPPRRQPRAGSGMPRLVRVFAAGLCCAVAVAVAVPVRPRTGPSPSGLLPAGVSVLEFLPSDSQLGGERVREVELFSQVFDAVVAETEGDIPDAAFDRYVQTVRKLMPVVPPAADQAAWWGTPSVSHPALDGRVYEQYEQYSKKPEFLRAFRADRSSEQSLLVQQRAVDAVSLNLQPDESQQAVERSMLSHISRDLGTDRFFLKDIISEWKKLVANGSPDEIFLRKRINSNKSVGRKAVGTRGLRGDH
ncbi:MAG: hypothetical protein BJ554DRAFT_1779 [Olpidium bornovanus]|uniref:Uncharacterized protein n=1 Tax=Olpidium bornovanus TaxID=278681 RepID=A0A8H7ZRV4_9FUNG|nr:MAG: hypothetical protein BJ554DRAFT_1779 [Olpidium bornovanus]